MKKYDFSGWATRANVPCSDGRTILKDAFLKNDGKTVPLVWNHQHNDAENILGHALLENREEGVYAYCSLNDSSFGRHAKLLIEHGDITALSIYANQLKQQGPNVVHGAIRELSIVLAGANPEAFIESVMKHGEESEEEALMFFNEPFELSHAGDNTQVSENGEGAKKTEEETVESILDTLTEKQKNVVFGMIGQLIDEEQEEVNDSEGGENTMKQNATDPEQEQEQEEGGITMKHNAFDKSTQTEDKNVLTHAAIGAAIAEGKRFGSMKESFLEHGITDVGFLFPEAQTLTNTPEFIKRDTGWVGKVMGAVHKTPFSRIKSVFADITAEDARAKGYIKGNLKKEEVFSLLKRTTTATTVYKKQRMDRDDIIEITEYDVIAWLKTEMRIMLDEEIARAVLVGDGRLASSDDKINDQNIRPVWTDDDLYTIKYPIVVPDTGRTEAIIAKAFIRGVIKSRKEYKGSGNPTLYTTEETLTECLLLEDNTGRVIYESVEKLATTLRVKEIITVPVMEGLIRESGANRFFLVGLVVNMADYNVGADKGGAVNMFDDFDIDYNKMIYLIETRCSGALTKPYSAIAVELKVVSTAG